MPLLPILLQAITSGQLAIATGGEAAPITAGINLRLPEGDMVYVPPDRLQRWLRPLVELRLAGLSKGGELRLPRIVAAQLEFDPPQDDELVPRPRQERAEAPLTAMRTQLEALLQLTPRRESDRFLGTLRSYQRLGVAWLWALHDAHLGGILADEMGLGKTIQVLAFLEMLHADARAETLADQVAMPSLVVAPRSVVENWYAETMRFAPQLRPLLHLGKDRHAESGALAEAPLVLTSYQTLLRDLEVFEAVRWRTIMFDEAQQLKNADSQLRKAAARLVAQSRFCLTGTPIENHLGELWSQADLVVPGLFGRLASFNAVFRRSIEKHGNHERLAMLRQRLAPFLLRRRKADVEFDLPPKTEIVERIELDTAQRDLYETLRLKLDDQVQRTLRLKNIGGAPIEVLDALLKLRQCCCDPRLIALPEARRVTSSAKLERLCDMLEQLADSGRKTLVFSQFASMLALIEAEVQRRGISYSMLTGATRDRAKAIAAFQTGEAAVFLISLKAGGVGLNLTAADTVIHYDPWWNPAAQAQATDRAHRIGQTKPLTVYKLVARGTLEEAICALQAEKQQLTDAALVGGGFTSLRAEDLSALLQQAEAL
ncbi:MAG: DEAD/DEAH box helicase [Myxococcales bacterium]|nr:DEAD/DEAH box helicase [Myxococcales bacterium]